jgi:hypothetical protein
MSIILADKQFTCRDLVAIGSDWQQCRVCTNSTGATDWLICAANPEGLAELKAELQQQLANIDEQEKLVKKNLAPASLEQAEMLEKKLVEALDEVKSVKARLKKQPK